MAEAPFVTDEARALIGKETTVTCKVSEQDIGKLAIAIGDLNPLYLDEQSAAKSRYGGIIAHPMHYRTTAFQPTPQSEVAEDGMPAGRDPPMEFSNHVMGGTEVVFFEPIRPGDTITAKRKIVDIAERQSSKGGWIAIVTRETTCTNQKGEVVVISRDVSIYS